MKCRRIQGKVRFSSRRTGRMRSNPQRNCSQVIVELTIQTRKLRDFVSSYNSVFVTSVIATSRFAVTWAAQYEGLAYSNFV